jgi:UDP-N-acetylglucosamine 1-carboxyvinyltransferase
MDQFEIEGGRPLHGRVKISGSKNAALPILIATLLTDETCVIENVPVLLRDIRTTFQLLESLGKGIAVQGSTVSVRHKASLKTHAPYDLVKQMRASVLVAGPLLARFGVVRVPIPGGCSIGLRPIDIHLKGFKALGARRLMDQGDIILSSRKLTPGRVRFNFPSVGATENLMMAAAGLEGETLIENAAREPEIADLGDFLTQMGASVKGAGSPVIRVRGKSVLSGCRYEVIPDRLEAGTFMIACALTQGKIEVLGAQPRHLEDVILKLRAAGAKIKADSQKISIAMSRRPMSISIETEPYPGFPTDLQALWMSLLSLADGKGLVRETIFENRFLHAGELSRMGAKISSHGNRARVEGVPELTGAPIMASDIRGGAALLVAALAAKGKSVLQRVYHIDRGYERVEEKLSRLGASIRRVKA